MRITIKSNDLFPIAVCANTMKLEPVEVSSIRAKKSLKTERNEQHKEMRATIVQKTWIPKSDTQHAAATSFPSYAPQWNTKTIPGLEHPLVFSACTYSIQPGSLHRKKHIYVVVLPQHPNCANQQSPWQAQKNGSSFPCHPFATKFPPDSQDITYRMGDSKNTVPTKVPPKARSSYWRDRPVVTSNPIRLHDARRAWRSLR